MSAYGFRCIATYARPYTGRDGVEAGTGNSAGARGTAWMRRTLRQGPYHRVSVRAGLLSQRPVDRYTDTARSLRDHETFSLAAVGHHRVVEFFIADLD
jgi:hypothetical protein